MGKSLFITETSSNQGPAIEMFQMINDQSREIVTGIFTQATQSRISEKIKIVGYLPWTRFLMILKATPIKPPKIEKLYR